MIVANKIDSANHIVYVNTSSEGADCQKSERLLQEPDMTETLCSFWCSTEANPWILIKLTETFYLSGLMVIQNSTMTPVKTIMVNYTMGDTETIHTADMYREVYHVFVLYIMIIKVKMRKYI